MKKTIKWDESKASFVFPLPKSEPWVIRMFIEMQDMSEEEWRRQFLCSFFAVSRTTHPGGKCEWLKGI